MQQTDSLTKKDIATWRQAWQAAISIDNPNRARLYDIYTDCLVDLHLTGCIGQRKGKTLQKDFRLVGKDGKRESGGYQIAAKKSGSITSATLCWTVASGGTASYSWATLCRMKTECVSRAWNSYRASMYALNTALSRPNLPRTGAREYRIARGDFALWCIEVGTPKDLGLLLKCAPSCISKKNMLAFLGHVRRDIRRAHARGAYQYNR